MRKIIFFTVICLVLTSCLKEEPLTPNKASSPLAEQPVVLDTTSGTGGSGGGTGGSGGGTGGGSTDPEFFNCYIDGTAYTSTTPIYNSGFGLSQIVSKSAASNIFNMGIFPGTSYPDTLEYNAFSSQLSFLNGNSTSYNAEKGMLIVTENGADKIVGNFSVTMFNASNSADSIIVTNGTFSVNK